MSLTPTEEAQTRQLIAQEAPLLSLAGNEPAITSKLGATKVNLSQLPAATVPADSDLFLTRQGTTDKSVAGSVLKTYFATSAPASASETVQGIVRLATDAETAAGTSRTLAVDPAGLAALLATFSIPDASTTVKGKIQLSTTGQAQALTDLLTAISPGALANAFKGSNQSLLANGYQKLPGGLIIQWGEITTVASADQPITFPIAFPNAVFRVFSSSTSTTANFTSSAYTYTLTGCLSKLQNGSSGAFSAGTLAWLAIGY